MEVETQQSIGCKMRVLVGYEKSKTFATVTTSKEDVDHQFCMLGGIKSSKSTKISRIIILGVMKMPVNWSTQNQLKTHILQKFRIYELL